MDIRLFKFIIFLIGEAVGFAGLLVVRTLSERGYLPSGAEAGAYVWMGLAALFALAPEDAWIWLIEEDLRNKKISLRKKACKHMEMSLLYCLVFAAPPFMVTLGMAVRGHAYVLPPTYVCLAAAAAFGLLCANLCFYNVRQYAPVFAVGWDRRVSFVEIFFGVTSTRSARLFLNGGYLLYMAVLCAGSAATPVLYYRLHENLIGPYDRERTLVLNSLFHFTLTTSTWMVSLYFFFQFFYVKKMESWAVSRKKKLEPEEEADEL